MEFKLLKEEENFIKNCSDAIERTLRSREENLLKEKYQIFESLRDMIIKDFVMTLRKNCELFKWFQSYNVALASVIDQFQHSGLKKEDNQLFLFVKDFDYFNNQEQIKKISFKEISQFLQKRLRNKLEYAISKYKFENEEYLHWRNEKLKYQNLEDKLPELEGIF